MTNQERLQSMSAAELAEFFTWLDKVGVVNYFNNRFCEDCKEKECEDSCKYEDTDVITHWLLQKESND